MARTYVAGFIARGDEARKQSLLDFFAQILGRPITTTTWKTGHGRMYWIPTSTSLEWMSENDDGSLEPEVNGRYMDLRQLDTLARDCGYNVDPKSFYRQS